MNENTAAQALLLYRQASAAYQEGSFENSLRLVLQSCRINKYLGWNWFLLGRLKERIGLKFEAAIAYEAALSSSPYDVEVLHLVALKSLSLILGGERLTRDFGNNCYEHWIQLYEPPLQRIGIASDLKIMSTQFLRKNSRCGQWPKSGWLLFKSPNTQLRPGFLTEIQAVLSCTAPENIPHIIYADEDQIDSSKNRTNPWFKPGFTFETFITTPWLLNFSLWNIEWLRKNKLPFPPADESELLAWQLHALCLNPKQKHIPRILSHSSLPTNNAFRNENADSIYGFLSAQNERISSIKPHEDCSHGYIVSWAVPESTTCTIIIPTKDRGDLLSVCLNSILKTASSATSISWNIVIVDNASHCQETFDLFHSWKERLGERLSVIQDGNDFNWSRLNNVAARQSFSRLLLLLNNDIEAKASGWIEGMACQAIRREIGIVGAVLTYDDSTIQHAGIAVGVRDAIFHPYRRFALNHSAHGRRTEFLTNWGAVTGACMMVERRKLAEVGWLNEAYPVEYNDVEICLRMMNHGYRNLVVPGACLIHYESQSRDALNSKTELPSRQLILKEYPQYFADSLPWWPQQASRYWEDGRPKYMPGEPSRLMQ